MNEQDRKDFWEDQAETFLQKQENFQKSKRAIRTRLIVNFKRKRNQRLYDLSSKVKKDQSGSEVEDRVGEEIQKKPQSESKFIDKDMVELIQKIHEDHRQEMANLKKNVELKLREAKFNSEVQPDLNLIPDCMMPGYDPMGYKGILGDLRDSEAAYSLRRLQDSYLKKAGCEEQFKVQDSQVKKVLSEEKVGTQQMSEGATQGLPHKATSAQVHYEQGGSKMKSDKLEGGPVKPLGFQKVNTEEKEEVTLVDAKLQRQLSHFYLIHGGECRARDLRDNCPKDHDSLTKFLHCDCCKFDDLYSCKFGLDCRYAHDCLCKEEIQDLFREAIKKDKLQRQLKLNKPFAQQQSQKKVFSTR